MPENGTWKLLGDPLVRLRTLIPRCTQNRPEINPKSSRNRPPDWLRIYLGAGLDFIPILGRFWIPFGDVFRTPWRPKPSKTPPQNTRRNRTEQLTKNHVQNVWKMMPNQSQNTPQNTSKTPVETRRKTMAKRILLNCWKHAETRGFSTFYLIGVGTEKHTKTYENQSQNDPKRFPKSHSSHMLGKVW